jgi:hypothetical protein
MAANNVNRIIVGIGEHWNYNIRVEKFLLGDTGRWISQVVIATHGGEMALTTDAARGLLDELQRAIERAEAQPAAAERGEGGE